MTGLIVDNFAGGGGASTGIEAALGRAVDIAINHDEEAIRMHEVNHPGTRHIRNNIWQVDPREVTRGEHVRLAWFSPDCKHFSKAKGGKPREKSIRDLAWVVVLWAQRVKPDVILLENVEEFRTWGPLDEAGYPIKARAGETFEKWSRELRKAGYRIQWKELRACDYGAPTIRKRFFMIARRDGEPIVWPKPSHGKPGSPEVLSGERLPWRTAAEIIDWSLPCPSIFERKKPLAEKTLRRIAHGIMKFVVNNPRPFIVPLSFGNGAVSPDDPLQTVTTQGNRFNVVAPIFARTAHGDVDSKGKRRGKGSHEVAEPFPTISTSQDSALVAAHLISTRNGEREGQAPRARDVEEPFPTVTAKGSQGAVVETVLSPVIVGCGGRRGQSGPAGPEAPYPTTTAKADACLVSAFLAQFSETREGRKLNPGHSVDEPVSTIVQKGPLQAVVASNLIKLRGTSRDGQPTDEPLHTVSAGGTHMGEVRAFLIKYYGNEQDGHGLDAPIGTVTVQDRFGLVTVTIEGEEYVIVDIGMRMLTPRELFNAQGFPPDYIIDHDAQGRPITKTAQVAKCGNSVCPPLSQALTRANLPGECAATEREAA